MADGKHCIACEAELPSSAQRCTHCGASQATRLRHTAMLSAADVDAALGRAAPPPAQDPEPLTPRRGTPHPSQTADTYTDLDEAARIALQLVGEPVLPPSPADEPGSTPAALLDSPRTSPLQGSTGLATPTPTASLSFDAPTAAGARERTAPASFPAMARAVMAIGGLVLLGVFIGNAPLLGAYAGNPLILAMYYLVGGVALLAAALLPLPDRLRASVAAVVGAVPLFVAPPLVALDGWRGLFAAFIVLLLPGALLLRGRTAASPLTRAIVVVGVALTALIYLVPIEDVVPLVLAAKLFSTGSIDHILVGVITLAPLALALVTLLALGRGAGAGFCNLWASLLVAAVAFAVAIAGLAGAPADLSLVHLGVALLPAGAAAAVGVAQLLDVDAAA